MKSTGFDRDLQYVKFCLYGFLKNLRFYEPFLMLFFLEKGLTFAEIGTLYATREICINLFEIPSGVLADAMGRRITLAASFAGYMIAFGTFYTGQEFWLLLVAMILYAFGDAFRTGTHKAMIFDYLNEKGWSHLRAHYYGHTRSWSQRGAAVSALLAAALVFLQGSYAPVFLFTMIPYTLDMILILSYPRSLDGPRQGSQKSVRNEFAGVLRSLVVTMKQARVRRAIANQALYTGYYKACKDYLQPILKTVALSAPLLLDLADQERTAILVGVVYAALFGITAFASRRSGRLADRYQDLIRPLNLTLLVGIGLGLAGGSLYWLGLPALAVLLYMGIPVVENLRKPMGIAFVSERMEQQSLASGLSVESQVETLFAAVIAFVLGLLSTLLGLGPAIVLVSVSAATFGVLIRLRHEPATTEMRVPPGQSLSSR